jgi:hypothetical protein
MKTPDDALVLFFMVLPWLAGTVLAKGFWLTTAAILFPPYAWYLVVQRMLVAIGWASL